MGFISTIVVQSALCVCVCESRVLMDKFSKYSTYSVLLIVLGVENPAVNQRDEVLGVCLLVAGDRNI